MSPFGSATCKLIFREAHKNPAFGGVFLLETFNLAASRRPDRYPERDEPALTPLKPHLLTLELQITGTQYPDDLMRVRKEQLSSVS